MWLCVCVLQTAVMQSPFSNGGSPVPESLTEGSDTRFTYVPTVSGGGDATQGSVEAVGGGGALGQVNTVGGATSLLLLLLLTTISLGNVQV